MDESTQKLSCSVCGCEVVRDGDTLKRECGHDEAAVAADLVAMVYGQGGVS